MKAMEFLTLLGELDEGELTSAAPAVKIRSNQRKKRRALWTAAACLCVCILGFSAWFFLPPMGAVDQALQFTVMRVEDTLLSYEVIKTDRLSPFERALLPDTAGEVIATHGDSTFYRAAGEGDLVYLIQIDGDGEQTVLRFLDTVNTAGIDMTESYWYDAGWLDDEDIAALREGADPTLGDVLQTVYGVGSAEDIRSIRFGRYGDSDGVSRRVRIKAVKVTDRAELTRIYGMLIGMEPIPYGMALETGSANARDEAYVNGEKPLSAQVDREITVTLTSGRELTLYYHPAAGLLRQNRPEMYTTLSEADNQWLMTLAEVDPEWKDWGTEKAPDYGGEGCETATAPAP